MATPALRSKKPVMPTAALLTIGNELLNGRTTNTNAAFLGAGLTRLGFRVLHQQACPDDIASIQTALGELSHTDVLIVTGGLGPTPDDLTREAIAAYFSVPLQFSKEQFSAMRTIYRKLGRKIPALSKREAYYPANAQPLINRFGIALGFWIQSSKQTMIVLPGVPTELQKMFEHEVQPLLKNIFPRLSADQTLIARMVGISEPNIMEKLGNDFFDHPFQFGIYPSEGETQICIRSPSKKVISVLKSKIKKRLKDFVYGWGDQSLPELIGELLTKKKKTVSVAESCTGGSLAFSWIKNAGASRFFRGGAVVYNASAKARLGVAPDMLIQFGEVSGEVAAELACRACDYWKTDFGIGVTGIAGPSGGTLKKPTGLVFIAVAHQSRVSVERHLFWGNREQIQRKAVSKALEQIWRRLI